MSSRGNITKVFSFFYSPSYIFAAVGDEIPREDTSPTWSILFYGKKFPNNGSANTCLENKAMMIHIPRAILWLLITDLSAVLL